MPHSTCLDCSARSLRCLTGPGAEAACSFAGSAGPRSPINSSTNSFTSCSKCISSDLSCTRRSCHLCDVMLTTASSVMGIMGWEWPERLAAAQQCMPVQPQHHVTKVQM